ncbi:MAG: DUF2480 family protein [Balneolales bacterium]|nr:DUF2480 family protein [Balneolales bacterium]
MFENKVAKSGLITLDLEKFVEKTEIVSFDLKDFLFMELILKEKDFRESLKEFDWTSCTNKIIAVHCSTDAIIAHWAFMLVVSHASDYASKTVFGNPESVRLSLSIKNLEAHNWAQYDGKRVLFKGCSVEQLNPAIYAAATACILPYTERLMYGEACSFVPVYKKSKQPKAV